MSFILAGVGVLFIILVLIVSSYNGLIRKKNNVENAFGGMDAQLKKRYDLIPNIVAAVKQYVAHEKSLLENITALRSRALGGNLNSDEKVAIDNEISSSLRGIMVSVENYPDLKSSENFLNLQRTLNEIESQISAARRSFNAAVTVLNNAVESFPSNIFAGMMKLKRREIFVIPEAERQNVSVGKLFNG